MKKFILSLSFLATIFGFTTINATAQQGSSNVQHVTNATFDNDVKSDKTIVLVDFYATWCPPCQRLAPVLEQMAKEFKGKVRIMKVDVDQEKALTARFGVNRYPTMVIVDANGKELKRTIGGLDAASLRAWLQNTLDGK